MEQTNITQIIIDTINTILGNLFSSIDNNLYSLLDDITFISSDILNDKNSRLFLRKLLLSQKSKSYILDTSLSFFRLYK